MYHVSQPRNSETLLNYSIRQFGPKLTPLLQVGFRGLVEVDSGFQARLVTINDYRKTCSPQTWEAMMSYSNSLKGKDKKIAFFSSTPQGGGVALMRHALVRLADLLGINLKWYSDYLDAIQTKLTNTQVCAEAKTRGILDYQGNTQYSAGMLNVFFSEYNSSHSLGYWQA
jgi:hypothetical protein